MKKKLFAVLMAATMVSSLVACGDTAPATTDTAETATEQTAEPAAEPAADTATEAPAAEATDMRVAMVTDYGDITDQSFNQSTYEACKAFGEANGVDFTY